MISPTRVCLALALLSAAGCAGARFTVTADSARYPISFSPALRGPDDRTLFLDDELRRLGPCEFDRTPIGLVYGSYWTTLDLSDDLNQCVAARHGEGLVALSVKVKNCVLAETLLFPLTLLPFYPGCMSVHVSAIVVARNLAAGGQAPREVRR